MFLFQIRLFKILFLFAASLLSVSIKFDPFGFTVKDLKTCISLEWCNNDHHELYPILLSSFMSISYSTNVAISYDIWHRCLGHPGSSIFQVLHSCNFISCPTKDSKLWHACQLGKHCRLPFTLSHTTMSRVFELVQFDRWTSPISNISGFKYFVIFLDDFSHFLYIFPLCPKYDVFYVF